MYIDIIWDGLLHDLFDKVNDKIFQNSIILLHYSCPSYLYFLFISYFFQNFFKSS